MGGVRGKHLAQVLLAEDQHSVGDLGSDGQHEAFGEAVCGLFTIEGVVGA
jgi:hypothetical protein